MNSEPGLYELLPIEPTTQERRKEESASHPQLGVKLLRDGARMPERAHEGDAGLDVFACLDDAVTIASGATVKIPLGIALDIPAGYFIDVRGRSGNELRGDWVVRLGTVDAGYRNELCAIVNVPWRWGAPNCTIHPGTKIAQLVIQKCETLPLVKVDALSETDRGVNGFGSSDAKAVAE